MIVSAFLTFRSRYQLPGESVRSKQRLPARRQPSARHTFKRLSRIWSYGKEKQKAVWLGQWVGGLRLAIRTKVRAKRKKMKIVFENLLPEQRTRGNDAFVKDDGFPTKAERNSDPA
jgi:hypothetical protein